MPVMEIIRHKTFAVVRKTAKSMKVSCHESFMVYGIFAQVFSIFAQVFSIFAQGCYILRKLANIARHYKIWNTL